MRSVEQPTMRQHAHEQGAAKDSAPDRPAVTTAPSVLSEINFYPHDVDFGPHGLYNYLVALPDRPKTTLTMSEPFPVELRDIRPYLSSKDAIKEAGLELQEAAFEVVDAFGFPETASDLQQGRIKDEVYVTEKYYTDVIRILQKRLGNEGSQLSILVLGHRVRQRTADAVQPLSEPNRTAHADQSDDEGLKLVEEQFGHAAAERLRLARQAGTSNGVDGPKAMIINVWRLLKDNDVNDWPLAMLDARTLDPSHLITGSLYQNGPLPTGRYLIGERAWGFYGLQHPGPASEEMVVNEQKWWYVGQQKASEAILLRIWSVQMIRTSVLIVQLTIVSAQLTLTLTSTSFYPPGTRDSP